MPVFVPDRAKLNPSFEAYRLLSPDDDILSRISLDVPVIGKVAFAPLALAQVQARAGRNHLACALDGSRALFIDSTGRVKEISHASDGELHIRTVHALPDVIESPEVKINAPEETELPSVAAASDSGQIWVVSDGRGGCFILELQADADVTVLASHEVLNDDDRPLPFVCLAACEDNESVSALILSARRIPKGERDEKARRSVEFTVRVIQAPMSSEGSVKTTWTGKTYDAPTHAFYSPMIQSFFVLSPSPLGSLALQHPAPPSADELAPIPRADESLDTSSAPYSWTQTTDSISVIFIFPTSPPLRASSFKISLQSSSISISLPDKSILPTSVLWAPIDSSASTWTFDPSTHTLSLELEKSNAGTRWPDLFSTSLLPNVSETLDPSHLANIRDALEKHTTDEDGVFSGPVPSLARGEADDELDSESGPAHYVTYIPATSTSSHPRNDSTPIGLLAAPLPGLHYAGPSVVSKTGLDGVLFSLSSSTWTHQATFPALAFVLASKRDVRFTYHAGPAGVLALEAGSAERGAGNLYFYKGGERGQTYGQQMIVRVGGGGQGGMLVGVGLLGKSLVCLCEREAVLLQGLVE